MLIACVMFYMNVSFTDVHCELRAAFSRRVAKARGMGKFNLRSENKIERTKIKKRGNEHFEMKTNDSRNLNSVE